MHFINLGVVIWFSQRVHLAKLSLFLRSYAPLAKNLVPSVLSWRCIEGPEKLLGWWILLRGGPYVYFSGFLHRGNTIYRFKISLKMLWFISIDEALAPPCEIYCFVKFYTTPLSLSQKKIKSLITPSSSGSLPRQIKSEFLLNPDLEKDNFLHDQGFSQNTFTQEKMR